MVLGVPKSPFITIIGATGTGKSKVCGIVRIEFFGSDNKACRLLS